MKYNSIWLILVVLFIACNRTPPPEAPVDAAYKHWLIYNLDVKTFKDSDGDGEGDFNGLITKLPYIKSLGINTIWLAPFQPSPQQDDGYDVTDYTSIDKKLGTWADFKRFMATAKRLGLKVIMDIALNHTSIDHPWFRGRPDWYLWSKQRPKDWNKGMGFPEVEKDTWHYDTLRKQYYFHRFYYFQPDLNYQNPAVVREAEHTLAFWLNQGMDGFRLDAVPFIIDDPRKDAANPRFDFGILHQLTGFVKRCKKDAVLLGEANIEPKENEKYFAGHHDGLQMMFNFYANQYLFYALATGDATEFKKALVKTQLKPGVAQWAWFLRNHDEIDLGRLSHHQLTQVYDQMGPDSNMRLYRRGIRRRLAPMLGNNMQRLKLAYSLLYSLPGTPVVRQGEEIGMGDDLQLKERLSVRTPMQWDSTAGAGFSAGKPFRPVINSNIYGYLKVNVAAEQHNPQSLLSFIQTIIQRRSDYPEILNGQWKILDTQKVLLAILYEDKGRQALIVHNFSGQPQQFEHNRLRFNLPAYGFKWLRLK